MFIDELDTVVEGVTNQLLTEMDGMGDKRNVLIIGTFENSKIENVVIVSLYTSCNYRQYYFCKHCT